MKTDTEQSRDTTRRVQLRESIVAQLQELSRLGCSNEAAAELLRAKVQILLLESSWRAAKARNWGGAGSPVR